MMDTNSRPGVRNPLDLVYVCALCVERVLFMAPPASDNTNIPGTNEPAKSIKRKQIFYYGFLHKETQTQLALLSV